MSSKLLSKGTNELAVGLYLHQDFAIYTANISVAYRIYEVIRKPAILRQ